MPRQPTPSLPLLCLSRSRRPWSGSQGWASMAAICPTASAPAIRCMEDLDFSERFSIPSQRGSLSRAGDLDHKIDRGHDDQEHASATDHTDLLFVGGGAAAVEQGLRPDQHHHANDRWNYNVNKRHFHPLRILHFSKALCCCRFLCRAGTPLQLERYTMRLGARGKIQAWRTHLHGKWSVGCRALLSCNRSALPGC